MARVMRRSATRRSSLAFASVVSMRSCATRFAVKARSMARRWLVLRPNFRPAFLCLMMSARLLLLLPAFEHRRPAVELHAETETHRGEDLLDLLQRLAAEVL